MATKRSVVQGSTSVTITDDAGNNTVVPVTSPPANGTDNGLPVHANLGSQTIAVDQITAGAANLGTSQVSVNGSVTLLLTARPTRRSALITNTNATNILYIGGSAVTSGTGHPILPQQSCMVPFTGAIYGITASATITVGASEAYD